VTEDYRDGNMLAGPLIDVFAVDVTASVAVCAGCRRTDRVATLRVYGRGPGVVARCPGCDSIMMRYAETPHGRWLDMTGTAVLRFDTAGPS
jgi:hypothetical protein